MRSCAPSSRTWWCAASLTARPKAKPTAQTPTARARSASRGAWVTAPVDTSRLAEICLDGEVWNTDGPLLSEVLEIIDETEARLNEGRLVGRC